MLGEQFMVGEEICGAVVSIRFQEDILRFNRVMFFLLFSLNLFVDCLKFLNHFFAAFGTELRATRQ